MIRAADDNHGLQPYSLKAAASMLDHDVRGPRTCTHDPRHISLGSFSIAGRHRGSIAGRHRGPPHLNRLSADITRLHGKLLHEFRRKVQLVFQDPYRSLNPRRTVGSAIMEGPINFGASKAEARQRSAELMEMVKLSPAAMARYPHEFSGGQRQRICIARALAVAPEVLIADEAVSALDVSVQSQILALIEELQRRFNLTVVFITHDLRVAAQICNSIVVMQEGRVVEKGTAAQVFRNPQHDYTQSLLAAAPGRDFVFGPGVQ